MPHIHTGTDQYDHTASAMVLRTMNDELKLLVHMHKKYHMLMQPGGHVEINENIWQAVLHEIREETGYTKKQLKVLQPEWAIKQLDSVVIHPIPFSINSHMVHNGHYHTDMTYLFGTDEDPENSPSAGESEDIRWLNRHRVATMSDSEMAANVREIALKAFDLYEGWTQYDATDYDERLT